MISWCWSLYGCQAVFLWSSPPKHVLVDSGYQGYERNDFWLPLDSRKRLSGRTEFLPTHLFIWPLRGPKKMNKSETSQKPCGPWTSWGLVNGFNFFVIAWMESLHPRNRWRSCRCESNQRPGVTREREREREEKKKHDRIWRYDLSSDVLKTCVTHIISKHIWYQFGYMIGHLDGLLQKGCEPLSTLATDEYNSLSCGRSIVACLAHCWTHWSLDEQEFKQWNIFWNVAWMINFVHMMHYHTTRLVSSTLRVPTCCLFFIYSTWWAVIVGHLFVQWKCLTFRVTYLNNLWHCNEHEMFFDDNNLLQKCRQYNDIHTLGIIGYDHIMILYDVVSAKCRISAYFN